MDDIHESADDQRKNGPERIPLPSADDSNIDWEETMLNKSFEDQLKLMDKSIKGGETTATKSHQHSTQIQHQQQRPKTSMSQLSPNLRRDFKLTNKSQLFRFVDGDKHETPSPQAGTQTIVKELASRVKVMPPPFPSDLSKPATEEEAHTSMLMAWYVAGYHAGYYEAVKKFSNK